MMSRFFFLIVFNVNSTFAAELSINLKTHADTTPFEIRKNHKELSHYLAQACSNEDDKVLIFSYWIAKNIRYDLSEAKSNKRNKIAREVLRDRSAVCGGYSVLLKQLCQNEGITCNVIKGFGRAGFFKNTFRKKKLLHGWNIVQTNNEWKCVDVTWMTDIVKTSDFKKSLKMKWVYMDPVEFSETHLPYDPRWQLRKDPNTTKEFWKGKDLVKRKYAVSDSMN